jgi:DNA-binding LytR/AlgR family response regulator
MPRIDGFEMLRILRKAPESAQVRIVVVTGLDQVAIDARGGLPQDIEVLKKPVPFERLREIGIDTLRMRESLFPAA